MNLRKTGSLNSPKFVLSSELKEIKNPPSQKQNPAVGRHAKPTGSGNIKSFIVPSVVPRDSPDANNGSRRESLSTARATTVTSTKPSHLRQPSNAKFDMEAFSPSLASGPFGNTVDPKNESNFKCRISDNNAKESSEEKHLDVRSDGGISEKASPPTDHENRTITSVESTNPYIYYRRLLLHNMHSVKLYSILCVHIFTFTGLLHLVSLFLK